MKDKFFALVGVVLLASPLFSQDIIYKNDKTEVRSKIIEILENEIKYKKFDFQDGPTYTMPASDIYMIIYKNGQKEMFANRKPAAATNSNTNTSSEKAFSSNTTSEYDLLKKSGHMMDFGFTIKNFSDYQIPNLIFSTDMLLWDNISIGGHVGMNTIADEQNIAGNTLKFKASSTALGVRGNYYANRFLKLDPDKIHAYGGLSLIYSMVNTSTSSSNSAIPSGSENKSDFNVHAQIGGRYFFGKHFGVNAEILFQDETNFKVGISYRLIPKK